MPTRTKICGITRPEDGIAAALAGADAIGLVFYQKSPRAVSIEQATRICAALPPFVTTVALFVDAGQLAIDDVLDAVPIDLLQFHGNETPAQCEAFAKPYIKAIRMSEEADLAEAAGEYASARGLLVDAWSPTEAGGTGECFEWARVSPAMRDGLETPIILAGGLHSGNFAEAIATVTPYAVDVISGVEVSKGSNDIAKTTAFMQSGRQGDNT